MTRIVFVRMQVSSRYQISLFKNPTVFLDKRKRTFTLNKPLVDSYIVTNYLNGRAEVTCMLYKYVEKLFKFLIVDQKNIGETGDG